MCRFLRQFARFGEWQERKILESPVHRSNHLHGQLSSLVDALQISPSVASKNGYNQIERQVITCV